jgi:hypothetical protein
MSVANEMKPSPLTRAKYHIKRAFWKLPAPISRAAFGLAVKAGLVGNYFLIYEKLGRPKEVLDGPFKGLSYPPFARGSVFLPKILGSYESELHPILDQLAKEPCDVIVDIGSAEGYYAIGLSKRYEDSKVYCFDTDPLARDSLGRLSQLNGVAERMIVGGFCQPSDLQTILEKAIDPLVICDCEGGEFDLLDPVAVPDLRKARIIVEVHDFGGSKTIGNALKARFSVTHHIEIIPTRPRHFSEIPSMLQSRLTEEEGLAALSESRPEVPGWMFLRPSTTPPG